MNCPVCKVGRSKPGFTVVTLNRGEATIVIKGVPAEVCDSCGEYSLSADIAARVYAMAEESIKNGAEVDVRRYVA
jgi:YgiT-type zinc finger domain-containing protein